MAYRRYRTRIVHFTVSPEQIKQQPDIWFEGIPGWITTHALADQRWQLDIYQKVREDKNTGNIRAVFTKSLHHLSGVRLYYPNKAALNDWPDLWQYLQFQTVDDRFAPYLDYAIRPFGMCTMSLDKVLDTYGFDQLIKRHNQRMLENRDRSVYIEETKHTFDLREVG